LSREHQKYRAPDAIEHTRELLGKLARDVSVSDWHLVISVRPDDLPEVAIRLRDDDTLSCKYISCIIGVDFVDWMEALYILRSQKHAIPVRLRVRLDREKPEVPSVTYIWSGANWHEREAYDFFGIKFLGHPDLRRILTREDYDTHPMKKDAWPHRVRRTEWRWEGIDRPRRLPGEPDRRMRS
jgi:NADH-quinone oxidoreductase subunit C